MRSNHDSDQVVIVSDTHCGSTIGLCPPQVELDDGGVYKSNSLQAAAWKFWEQSFWPEVHRRAKTRDTVVVLNGDLVDGNHHGTTQIFTGNPLEQVNLAAQLFAPIASRYPVYVTRGTPAHVMASAAADEQIARGIGAVKPNSSQAVRSSYHLKLLFHDVLLDIAHHGPNPGRRIWTYGNELRGYGRTIVLDSLIGHFRPPDVIVRSHVHHRVRETLRDYHHTCEAIITPAWQWKTEFGHRVVSHEDIADVGGVIVSIDGGKVSDIEFLLLPLSQSDVVRVK